MASDSSTASPPSRIGRLLETVRILVRAGVLAPGRPDRVVRQLRALRTWGATIAGGYAAASERVPDGVAIVDDHGPVTFRDLHLRGRLLALELHRAGAGEGSRVGLLCRNHSAFVQTMIACGRLGADTVLLNTGMSAAQLSAAVAAHDVSVLVLDDEFEALCADIDLPRFRAWTDSEGSGPQVPWKAGAVAGEEPAPPRTPSRLIVLTSGTTGAPKGARRPTPKGPQDGASVLSRIPLNSSDRILVAAPVFHTWGLAGVQLGMAMRSTLVMRRLFDAEDVLRTVQEQRCTALFAVPVMLRRIMELPASVRRAYDTSSLRIVACSGSAMDPGLITSFMDEFGDVLYNLYGSTEVSWATIATPEDMRLSPTTAGRPPLGTRIAILDDSGAELPAGSEGSIYVGNDMLFDGYTNGQGRKVADGLMETGDRGHIDTHGLLHVSGRNDDMIVSGGENLFPRPVEEAISALPGVREAVVAGVPDEEFGQRFAAFVVAHEGETLDPEEIRAHVRQVLGRFSVPRDVVLVDELPRNATGKVVRRRLPFDAS
ncbi:AMP-binding protein [Nocardiopsis algeriensis]|uniref:Acyl-CoA synthetase (AMP-forming)/AMP-acid ligase II n=1 Tax=Nocardiopsis algeriensis TaxID=1478215 RepID=A0A841IWV3_9ACTN|nr:AMP-binding protein [Nocardiopsis algeriensis]MBB6121756.1 acyl-CoA synthetase (AMP-forming)/AMP-acid ligase II [Nocardiopsis algeriensis]